MYKCRICGKEYDTKQKLGGHATVHTRKAIKKVSYLKPCEYCGKEFLYSTWGATRFCSRECCSKFRRKSSDYKRAKALEYRFKDIIRNKTGKELLLYKKEHPYCEICGKRESVKIRNKKISLAIDHDHRTGNFRGILCNFCNTKVEWFIENKKSIEDYLNRPNP